MTYLNPVLYRNIERKFGAGSVLVSNEGVGIVWELRYDAAAKKYRRFVIVSGEEYRVNCPFCGDTRRRLYINHRFGVTDPETGDDNLWLARCFNEECLSYDTSLRELLYFEILAGRSVLSSAVRRGAGLSAVKAELPGMICYVDQLDPSHHASVYLRERGFDPVSLGRQWRVSYCLESSNRLTVGRLIIPVYARGELAGWMARLVGDGDWYFPGTLHKVPKYYNMPGFQRRYHAFNFDAASQFRTIILVEGALDAIRTGFCAAGILGKSLSYEMRQRVITAARTNGEGTTIAVMLDPDQDKREAVLKEKHHIARLAEQLREGWPQVLEVYLPSGTDPGSTRPDLLRRYIEEAAFHAGITLDWRQVLRPAAAGNYGRLWY